MSRYWSGGWAPYIPVSERRRRAMAALRRMKQKGRDTEPVKVTGRAIATSFWGKAWCSHLESFSDFSNRLPRGRTYVRNGSVVDLQIASGKVSALVSGSSLYEVEIAIERLAARRWAAVKRNCSGQIGSLVELLRGSLSHGVMEVVTHRKEGLFPGRTDIKMGCSCPDWATMCKHVSATLYGVGARLDSRPDLLFTLRGVDPGEMIEAAVSRPATRGRARASRVLASGDLSDVFGVEIDAAPAASRSRPTGRRQKPAAARKKTALASKKPAKKKAKAAPSRAGKTIRRKARKSK